MTIPAPTLFQNEAANLTRSLRCSIELLSKCSSSRMSVLLKYAVPVCPTYGAARALVSSQRVSFDPATLRLTLAPSSMRKHFACRQEFTAAHQFDVCGLFRRDSKRVRISVSAQHLLVIQLHRRAIK